MNLTAVSCDLRPLRTSKVAYFKRKYAEEEDLPSTTTTAFIHRRLIFMEERWSIMALSLEKLQFYTDSEVFLRRSVLIHNLLRKIHSPDMDPSPEPRPEPGPEPGLSRMRLITAVTVFSSETVLIYCNE